MSNKKKKGPPPRDANSRKFKKKASVLTIEKVEYVDYKDVDLLTRFVSDRAKIRNSRVAGNNPQQQREISNAVKIAREMALLPYAVRVANTRVSGGRRGDRDRDSGRQKTGQVKDTEELDAVAAVDEKADI